MEISKDQIEKQAIEEMAKAMCGNVMPNENCATDDEPCFLECVYGYCAERLYQKDYRKQEWINIEERLPESGVHCILCCDMKMIDGTHSQYVCDGYFAERWKINVHYADDDCETEYNEEDDEYYLKEGWYEVIKNCDDYNSIEIDDIVTHWMPLPEPPKMRKEDEGK